MEVALDGAASAGARFVEPAYIRGYVPFTEDDFADAPARALRDALAARGLRAGALSAHLDLSAPDAVDALRRRIGFAATIGAPFVVTNAGPAARIHAVRGTIDAALPVARAAGVVLALENPGHGAGDLIGDAVAGAAFLDDIGAGPGVLGLNLDLGNVRTYAKGRVPLDGQIAAAGRHLVHLHLKDVADRDGGWTFTAIGEGDLPYDALLRDVPPDLPIGLELPLRLRRPGYADPARADAPMAIAAIDAAVRASLMRVGALSR